MHLCFWKTLQTLYFFKGFFIAMFLKSAQSYYFFKVLLLLIHEKKILFPCSNASRVPVKFYITYVITSIVFLSQLGYLLSILSISWSNFYKLHVLVLTVRTHDIMIFGWMNGKLPSKNSFWKWISCAEGENDEMGIPIPRDRSWLNNLRDAFINAKEN